ncbi:MAG: histidine phosphatase family protein [Candidatus Woesearchaeota archaeon]
MEIYLVRHGQSEGNISRVNEGWHDGALTELGRRQAERVGTRFARVAIDRIISSDLQRARMTAQAISAHHPNTPFTTDERLREWNLGVHEGSGYGTIFKEMDAGPHGRLDHPIERGETIRHFKERVHKAVDSIIEAYRDETVVIVTHGGFILNALLHLLELPDERFAEFDPENTGVAYLTVGDEVTLHYANNIEHLADDERSGFSTFQERERAAGLRITLVRHALSEGNIGRKVSGHHDHPLTQEGLEQAEKVGARLADEAYDHIYVSDLTRTRQTAEPIIRRHPDTPVTFDPRIREKHFGIHEGRNGADVAHVDVWGTSEGGESLESFHERIRSFIDEIAASHRGQHVLLVTHGGFITHTLLTLAGADPSEYEKYPVSNTSVTIIEFDIDRNHTVHLQNCTNHL